MGERYRESEGPYRGIPERFWTIDASGLKRKISMFAQAGDRHAGENIICQCTATAAQIHQCARDLLGMADSGKSRTRGYRLRLKCFEDGNKHIEDLLDDE